MQETSTKRDLADTWIFLWQGVEILWVFPCVYHLSVQMLCVTNNVLYFFFQHTTPLSRCLKPL